MARRKMDYSSYRGRKTFTDILRIIAVVLLILVVLGGGLLLFGQRYLVYRDGGVTLELPFFHREKGDGSQPGLGNISVVVHPSASSSEQGEDQNEPAVDAVAVTAEELLDGTAQEKAQQAGASAIVVDMKMDSGALGWRSGEAIARNVRANSQTEQVNENLTQRDAAAHRGPAVLLQGWTGRSGLRLCSARQRRKSLEGQRWRPVDHS